MRRNIDYVVPYIGTWIETFLFGSGTSSAWVVPYIGTWIETQAGLATCFGNSVVPYIGTWIETSLYRCPLWFLCRTLYRYVDWNQTGINGKKAGSSRTLYRYVDWNWKLSSKITNRSTSRTLYRYVDWNTFWAIRATALSVVPYIGTWIETYFRSREQYLKRSYLI